MIHCGLFWYFKVHFATIELILVCWGSFWNVKSYFCTLGVTISKPGLIWQIFKQGWKNHYIGGREGDTKDYQMCIKKILSLVLFLTRKLSKKFLPFIQPFWVDDSVFFGNFTLISGIQAQ